MRAVADHEIKQNDARPRDRRAPRARHRRGPTDRSWDAAGRRDIRRRRDRRCGPVPLPPGRAIGRRERLVRCHLAAAACEDHLRFGAQRAAGEQSATRCPPCAALQRGRGVAELTAERSPPPAHFGGCLQRRGKTRIRRQIRRCAAPMKHTVKGLRLLPTRASTPWRQPRAAAWRSARCDRSRDRLERVDRRQRRDAADLRLQIPPADADCVRHAAAAARDQARDFLHAGTGRADDADAAARHRIGKCDRHAADDGGPAVRSHHQQPASRASRFSASSSAIDDVVAEHHDMQARAQRLARFARRRTRRERKSSARLAPGADLDRRSASVRGRATRLRPPAAPSACRAADCASASAARAGAHRSSARIAMIRSLPLHRAFAHRAIRPSRRIALLAGVPIISAASTPAHGRELARHAASARPNRGRSPRRTPLRTTRS